MLICLKDSWERDFCLLFLFFCCYLESIIIQLGGNEMLFKNTGKKWAQSRKLVPLNRCSERDANHVVMVLIDHVIKIKKRVADLEKELKEMKK